MCANERSTSSPRSRMACLPTSERSRAVVVNRPACLLIAVPARDALALRFGNPGWLLSGFRVVTGTSGDEAGDEGTEESFAPAARVVHELEEAEIERQLVL